MFRIILLICTLGLCSAQLISPPVERNADNHCVRSDGRPGYCVHMNSCSFIARMLDRKKQGIPFTTEERQYLQNSECNDRRKEHVCCESEDKVDQGIQELSSHDCARRSTIAGYAIKPMPWPWMALLKFRTSKNTEEFTCGGALIHKNWILTAAHCFNNQELLSVRLGEYNTTSDRDCMLIRQREICAPPVEDFEIDRVIIHEQYSAKSVHNDIALVKLKGEAEINVHIKPICLPVTEAQQRYMETLAWFAVVGWGRSENASHSEVPVLTYVAARSRSDCGNSLEREIVPTQICTGGNRFDSCNGDSGGPLVYVDYINHSQRYVQYGIDSFGSRDCDEVSPRVYTNVGSFVPWIAYKIATK